MEPGRLTGRRWFTLRQGHGHGDHPAHDVAICRVANLADLHRRLRAWDQDQVVSIQLTPTAGIAISELHKIDGPLRDVTPAARRDFALSGIDGHNGAGANDGIKRVVLKPDLSAKTPFRIEALQNLDRNLRVGPKHSG